MISAPTDSPHILRTGQPSAERRRHDAYPFTATMQARYGDMDVNGHLNNLALESVHEDLRAHLNRRVFPDIYDVDHRDYRLVTAQNVVHFLAEAHWPATITASAGIGHIGRSSFVASTALFIDDKCISTCDSTLVLVRSAGPVAIPEHNRQLLHTLVLQIPTETASQSE